MLGRAAPRRRGKPGFGTAVADRSSALGTVQLRSVGISPTSRAQFDISHRGSATDAASEGRSCVFTVNAPSCVPSPRRLGWKSGSILLWWMRRSVCHEQISRPRVVIQFDFGGPKRRYWLIIRSNDVSVCLRHPGFEVDVLVPPISGVLIWLGRCAWSAVLHPEQVQSEGAPADTRAFARWFSRSPMADTVRAALTASQ